MFWTLYGYRKSKYAFVCSSRSKHYYLLGQNRSIEYMALWFDSNMFTQSLLYIQKLKKNRSFFFRRFIRLINTYQKALFLNLHTYIYLTLPPIYKHLIFYEKYLVDRQTDLQLRMKSLHCHYCKQSQDQSIKTRKNLLLLQYVFTFVKSTSTQFVYSHSSSIAWLV